MSQSPSLEEVLESAIGERLRSFYTALPGEIISYDESTQRADVRIKLTNATEDSAGTKTWLQPIVKSVVVVFPGGSSSGTNYRITFPVSAGDQVLYVVSTLPVQEWMNKGYANLDIDPIALNNLSSGFAIPGIHTASGAPTSAPKDAVVVHTDMMKVGSPSSSELVALKNDLVALRYALQTAVIALGAGGANAVVVGADAIATAMANGTSLPPGVSTGTWPVGAENLKVKAGTAI